MPYVKQNRRDAILERVFEKDRCTHKLRMYEVETAGELNYAITELLLDFFNRTPKNYQAINDVIGALEGAKCEFYRRKATPYEDEKIKENGDVY